MTGRKLAHCWAMLPVAAGALLVGCAQTPMGPTVAVMPGPGKSFETFQTDQAVCKNYAAGQVQGQAQAANNQALGTAAIGVLGGAAIGALGGAAFGNAGAGAAAGAAIGAGTGTAIGASGNAEAQMGIQAQYDTAYAQCMYSKGDQVPGYSPPPPMPPPGPVSMGPDPGLVRAVQSELIRLRYLNGVADGAAGPMTASAIRNYEAASGLPVDGAVSSNLLGRLQATPSSQAAGMAMPANATATAPAPAWVAPTQAGGVTPASATTTAPAKPAGWVAPTTTQ